MSEQSRERWLKEMADLEEEIRWAGDDPERLTPLYTEKRRLLAIGPHPSLTNPIGR